MQNLEFKARLQDFDGAVEVAQAIGADDRGVLQQLDTYFNTSTGRLKLREFMNSETPAELIAYQRSDEAVARLSDYERNEIGDPAALKRGLAATLGVRAVVAKDRHFSFGKVSVSTSTGSRAWATSSNSRLCSTTARPSPVPGRN